MIKFHSASCEINKLLNRFPKKRPNLSLKVKKLFNKFYKKNRENLISQYFESWMHRAIKKIKKKNTTLEIGAGTLNHINYENLSLTSYDIIEPKKYLYKNNIKRFKLRKIFKNLNKTKNNYYDRIISIAVLEHLVDLPFFLAESAKKLKKKNSYQSHSIPCEGYFAWGTSWYLFNFLKVRIKTGRSFKEIQKHEHVNSAKEILKIINYFYKKVRVKYSYPTYFLPHFSFYMNICFSEPDMIKVNNYLDFRKKNKIKNINL
jgi:hypothetical protein